MKWILNIVFFLILGCESKINRECSGLATKKVLVYQEFASINLPEVFSVIDTINYNFEYDRELLHYQRLYSHDSLSSVNIKVRQNPLSNAAMVRYSQELADYYRGIYNNKEDGYYSIKIDTLDGKKIAVFVFPSDFENSRSLVSVLVFYVERVRCEVVLKISQQNFKNIAETTNCIINSIVK